ncbi:MAG TPA: PAS domain S-box protein, partial [Opitutaceae bacterium]|nr:PAS domain S-box protein [Opitutaceae bacterium]
LLFENNPLPIWVYDAETLRFLSVNTAALECYGYTREEFMRMTIKDIRPPGEVEKLVDTVRTIQRGDRHFGVWQHQTKSGRLILMEIYSETLDFLNRRARLVQALDITGREQTVQALQASEARHRTLFEEAPIAIVELDFTAMVEEINRLRAEGAKDLESYFIEHPQTLRGLISKIVVADVNRAGLRLTGAKTKEEHAQKLVGIFANESIPVFARLIDSILDGRNAFESQISFRDFMDRSRVAIMRWSAPLVDGKIDLARSQVVLTDVTAIKAADKILRDSEERYRDLFENAAEGIFESTPEGRWVRVNPAFARMLGYESPAEMIEQATPIESLYARPGRRFEFFSLFKDHDRVMGFESEVKCKDGSVRWVSENVRAIRDDNGTLIRMQGFVVDITSRKLSEQEWLRASKLESVGILAGGIAHDFNNILTAILGNITLTLIDPNVPASTAKRLKDAERAALRARDLTQQLLTFAKGGEPVRAALKLGEIVREVADFSLHGSKIRCEYDLAPDLWPANADRGQISQVVQNLVINAVQATPEGGFLKIRARNETLGLLPGPPLTPGDYVKITISDTGAGIRPEHLAKIFDPYFTTKKQGSGLGLATVYSIVKKHHGLVEVESQIDVGTTFRIWLPAVRAMQLELHESVTSTKMLRGRVLFMDDEESIRLMARDLLTQLGLEVDLAASGGDAIDRFVQSMQASRVYDVVVMDLTVPGGMGGYDALQKIREMYPKVKAIVSSGYSSNPVMAEYKAHGFSGRVAKPYRVSDFMQTLREVMEQ